MPLHLAYKTENTAEQCSGNITLQSDMQLC